MKKFSIITVCLNEAERIEGTIQSLFLQNYNNYEYIIVDGASSDGTLDIINNYKSQITKFISEKDNGIYNAMNKGINIAEGEYIYFLNAGDKFSSSDVLSNVAGNSNKEDILFGDIKAYKDGREIIKIYEDTIKPEFFFNDQFCHQATFTRNDLFLQYGFFDETYSIAADYEFLLRVLIKQKATYKHINIPVVIFDLSGISRKPENLTTVLQEFKKARHKYFSYIFLLYMEKIKPMIKRVFLKI